MEILYEQCRIQRPEIFLDKEDLPDSSVTSGDDPRTHDS
mgnify:CR=1 FL=1